MSFLMSLPDCRECKYTCTQTGCLGQQDVFCVFTEVSLFRGVLNMGTTGVRVVFTCVYMYNVCESGTLWCVVRVD